jgi:hypothetical protein
MERFYIDAFVEPLAVVTDKPEFGGFNFAAGRGLKVGIFGLIFEKTIVGGRPNGKRPSDGEKRNPAQ